MVWLKVVDDDLLIRLNPLERFASMFHKDMQIPLAGVTGVEVSNRPLHRLNEKLSYSDWVKKPPTYLGTIQWYGLQDGPGTCFVSVYLPYRRSVIVRSDGSSGIALAVISQLSADRVADRIRDAVAVAKRAGAEPEVT